MEEPLWDFYDRCCCTSCSTVQYIYIGNPEDQTLPDPDGFVCYKCKAITTICDAAWIRIVGGKDNLRIVDGVAEK